MHFEVHSFALKIIMHKLLTVVKATPNKYLYLMFMYFIKNRIKIMKMLGKKTREILTKTILFNKQCEV